MVFTSSSRQRASLLSLLALLSTPAAVHAFNFTTPLVQCSNITMTWGAGGVAPYEILLIPLGHVQPIETRTIINYQNITPPSDSPTSFSFPLTFPAGSQFVAVLSDSRYGPGSGGTSSILTVQPPSSNDTSCLGNSQVKPEFYFYLDPPTPTQCEPWEISWPKSIASLSPTKDNAISLWAVVPGQMTFAVPLPDPESVQGDSSLECEAWTVDLKQGTEFLLVAGYEPGTTPAGSNKKPIRNGRGKGGSTDLLTVGSGGKSACLTEDPPATTLFPTSSPSSSSVPSPPSGTSTSVSGTQTPIGATTGQQGGGALPSLAALSRTSLAMTSLVVVVVAFFGGVGL